MAPAKEGVLRIRETADEVWALLEGRAEFIWHDRREGSPSYDLWHRLTSEEPTVVLVPFGVAFGVRAIGEEALFARLTTHEQRGKDESPSSSSDRET